MIKAKIVEVIPVSPNQVKQEELGFTWFPAVPLDLKPVQAGQPVVPTPMSINGKDYFAIGFAWDVKAAAHDVEPEDVSVQLIVIVQAVPRAPSLVRAGAGVLDELERRAPMVDPAR